MAKRGKEYLKEVFRKGALPTESHFSLLIDSMFNLEDDDFEDLLDGPLRLYLKEQEEGEDRRESLLKFYTAVSKADTQSSWRISLSEDEVLSFKNKVGDTVFHLDQSGNVVVGMGGIRVMEDLIHSGLKGQYSPNFRPVADGKWHSIIEGLEGCQVFQVTAGVGYKANSRFAIMQATVCLVPPKKNFWDFILPRFSHRNAVVNVTQAFGHSVGDKIDLKWERSDDNKYDLKIRTRNDFGAKTLIRYHISRQWFDPFMSIQ